MQFCFCSKKRSAVLPINFDVFSSGLFHLHKFFLLSKLLCSLTLGPNQKILNWEIGLSVFLSLESLGRGSHFRCPSSFQF